MTTALVFRWAASALAIFLTSYIVPGIRVSGFGAAAVGALVLGLVNTVIRPVLLILTLPINVVTLGLFTFVLNGFVLWLAGALVPGFEVRGFWSAVLGAIVVSLLNTIIGNLLD